MSCVEFFIPKTVEKIHKYAFYKCPKLQEVILQGNTIIEEDAFKDCHNNLRFIMGV